MSAQSAQDPNPRQDGAPDGGTNVTPAPEASPEVYQIHGEYRSNMSVFGQVPGVLRADLGGAEPRLMFTTDSGEVIFDHPIRELHSVGLTEYDTTLEVWQGDTRHRIYLATDALVTGNIVGIFDTNSNAKQWHDFLAPKVGAPPAGVTVKKPMGKGTTLLMVVVVSVLVVLLCLGVVVLLVVLS